jgi:hypothetical protein
MSGFVVSRTFEQWFMVPAMSALLVFGVVAAVGLWFDRV